MAKPPKTREFRRKFDTTPGLLTSHATVKHADLRQVGLFDHPPSFIAPCLPTLVGTPPSGPEWAHEIKHDGCRAISVIDRGKVSIFIRRGLDRADRMPGTARALAALKLRSAVIDGEAVMVGKDGISDFFDIHAALARRSAPHAVLMAFDVLHLDGEDLRDRALEDRRAILADLLRKPGSWLQFSQEIVGDGLTVLRGACDMGLEGIVSKRRGSPYRSGKADSWRKTKCTTTEHFAVIGAAPPAKAALRSLRLARLEAGELVPCGWAGSGLSANKGRDLRTALDAGRPVVAQVEHRGFTPAGELRHPIVRGWRHDA
ncbi:bifunctional non-homologous end joining protein LigD [Rhizobiales bacterium GAS191]|jgi:bifunctional non-homologous end joining protein LigD|nr:bifunctional non-homologous end joining protein LigD [Rhizobiales bacterium GAS191]